MRHFKETKNQGFFRVSWGVGGGARDRCVSTREGDAEYLKRRQLSRLQFTLYRKNHALGKNRQVMKRAKWYLVVKPSSMVACSAVNVLTRTESVEFHSFSLHYYRYGSAKKMSLQLCVFRAVDLCGFTWWLFASDPESVSCCSFSCNWILSCHEGNSFFFILVSSLTGQKLVLNYADIVQFFAIVLKVNLRNNLCDFPIFGSMQS